MSTKLQVHKIKDWVVVGQNFLTSPFKYADALTNEARIVHIVKGKSDLYSGNHSWQLSGGDTIIMKADNFINHWRANESGEESQVIVFQLTTQFLHYVYGTKLPEWFTSSQSVKRLSIEKASSSDLLKSYFENIQYYFNHPQFINEEILLLKIRELIHILIKTDQSGQIKSIFGDLFHANEYDFQEVIKLNLYKDLNTEDLAFLTGLSISSFKRKFKTLYGTSPIKYIISKKLERAQVLLARTNQRISEIAFESGFNDVAYFSKTFKSYYNSSPSDFRKQNLTE